MRSPSCSLHSCSATSSLIIDSLRPEPGLDSAKRTGGPWGLSTQQALSYIDASVNEGMQQVEEVSANALGDIELDGNNANGQEFEINYRSDSMTPRRVELDDRR